MTSQIKEGNKLYFYFPRSQHKNGRKTLTSSLDFLSFADGADDTREYEEMGDDSQATDVLNEVRGQERNKEEIFDTMKQYKAEKEIQDSRRPGLSKMKAQVDSQ